MIKARPFVKWAGGKTSSIETLLRFAPKNIDHYCEPFLGGGALFFALKQLHPEMRATLSDANKALINAYVQIRDRPDQVIELLTDCFDNHSKDLYYQIRDEFNRTGGDSPLHAAWFIYLNKTCFNGLFRVNSKGGFNAPCGKQASAPRCNSDAIRLVSEALQGVTLLSSDFGDLQIPETGSFLYFDPPYDLPEGFSKYTKNDFTQADQVALFELFASLSERGCQGMLSNSDTPFIRDLYKGFDSHELFIPRNINSKGDRRGSVTELLFLTGKGI